MNLPIIECSLVPMRYRSSPSILYIMPSISSKDMTPVTTSLRIIYGGDDVGKSLVDHKIARIREDCGSRPRHVAQKIVKALPARTARTVEVDAFESL